MLKILTSEFEWREAINGMNHDWYHTWDYHHIALLNGEGIPMLLVFGEKNSRICLPILLRKINDEWNDATSVYGYPGVVSNIKGDEKELYRLFFQDVMHWANENKVVSIFSRLNSCIDGSYEELNHLAESQGETVVIDLSLPIDEQRKRYRKNYRNLVNKLERDGVTCSWENNAKELSEFIGIYNQTMDSLGAADHYYFSRSYYDLLINSEDFEVRIYSCFHEGRKICSGLFVFCGDIVQYHLSGTVSEYKNSAPTRLMIDTVRKDATSLGYQVFHLGGGTGNGRDSLFDFKYGFSKEVVDFRVLKLITNEEKYVQLSGIDINDIDQPIEGFFPLYRKLNTN